MFPSISVFIGGNVDSTTLLLIAIVLCAFLIEDITTVVVGVLAADGVISVPMAIIFIYIGIIIGDTTLYSLGWLARTHPRLARYINHDFTYPFRSWLENNYSFKVFSGHFVPGLRFTTFVASGFFRFPLSKYMPMAIAGGLILELALFTISYWFGSFTSKWAGEVRWSIAAVFLLALFFIARYNIRIYRANRDAIVQASRTENI